MSKHIKNGHNFHCSKTLFWGGGGVVDVKRDDPNVNKHFDCFSKDTDKMHEKWAQDMQFESRLYFGVLKGKALNHDQKYKPWILT